MFKSYVDFESFKGVAQKLGPPRLFVFSTENGRISLDFAATRRLKKNYFS